MCNVVSLLQPVSVYSCSPTTSRLESERTRLLNCLREVSNNLLFLALKVDASAPQINEDRDKVCALDADDIVPRDDGALVQRLI
jgi:hypothetical protein